MNTLLALMTTSFFCLTFSSCSEPRQNTTVQNLQPHTKAKQTSQTTVKATRSPNSQLTTSKPTKTTDLFGSLGTLSPPKKATTSPFPVKGFPDARWLQREKTSNNSPPNQENCCIKGLPCCRRN